MLIDDVVSEVARLSREVERLKSVETPGRMGARVYRNTDQTITAGIATAISFSTERYDVGGCATLGTNPTRLTAPIAGVYVLFGGVAWETGGTSWRNLAIRIDGTTTIITDREHVTSSVDPIQSVACTYALSAGQYAELVVEHEHDTSLDILYQSAYSPEFGMHCIGVGM